MGYVFVRVVLMLESRFSKKISGMPGSSKMEQNFSVPYFTINGYSLTEADTPTYPQQRTMTFVENIITISDMIVTIKQVWKIIFRPILPKTNNITNAIIVVKAVGVEPTSKNGM